MFMSPEFRHELACPARRHAGERALRGCLGTWLPRSRGRASCSRASSSRTSGSGCARARWAASPRHVVVTRSCRSVAAWSSASARGDVNQHVWHPRAAPDDPGICTEARVRRRTVSSPRSPPSP